MFHNRVRCCVSVLLCLSVLGCGVRVEREEQELQVATNLSSAGSGTTSLVSGGGSAGATTGTGTSSGTSTATSTSTGSANSSTNQTTTDTSGATSGSVYGIWNKTTDKGTAQEVVTWLYIDQVDISIFRDELSFGGDGRNCFSRETQNRWSPASAYNPDAGPHEYEYAGVINTIFVQTDGTLYWSFIDSATEEAVVDILKRVENVQTPDDIQICT